MKLQIRAFEQYNDSYLVMKLVVESKHVAGKDPFRLAQKMIWAKIFIVFRCLLGLVVVAKSAPDSSEQVRLAKMVLKDITIEEHHFTHDIYPKLAEIPSHRIAHCYVDQFGSSDIKLFNASVHDMFEQIIV